MKAWMSLNFCQVRQLTMELAVLGHLSAFIFDQIFFILGGYEDMHKSLGEFEFQSDPTTDYGVNCH